LALAHTWPGSARNFKLRSNPPRARLVECKLKALRAHPALRQRVRQAYTALREGQLPGFPGPRVKDVPSLKLLLGQRQAAYDKAVAALEREAAQTPIAAAWEKEQQRRIKLDAGVLIDGVRVP
jgi:hypothetical protein